MTQDCQGVSFTREEFSKDPKGCLAHARPGYSVTVTDAEGRPRMRLELPPCEPIDPCADDDD